MYSPKIREEFIPKIYRVAKQAGIHMTTWVNDVIARALSEIPEAEEQPRPKKAFGKETDQ